MVIDNCSRSASNIFGVLHWQSKTLRKLRKTYLANHGAAQNYRSAPVASLSNCWLIAEVKGYGVIFSQNITLL